MRWPALLMLAVMFAIAAPALGCGDSGDEGPEAEAEGEESASEEEREEAEREAAAESIPEADRIAYYQVATGSGLLRAWAQAVSSGDEPPENAGDAELRAAERRLDRLEPPEDARLDDLAHRLRGGLRLALGLGVVGGGGGGGGGQRSLAPELVELSDEVNRELQRYLRTTPQVSILLPD